MSIVIENLCKNFGTHAVLQNFNWTVDRPMVLMGASGCGKTTLLRILSGLETADSGTVTGVVTPAVVFQEDRLCPQLTAVGNLVLTGHGLTAAQARSNLQSLGFTEADLRLPAVQLSGGQKQRIAIARALATNPKVLLCDEATSALDPNTTHAILQLIQKINREMGITVVIITHQMSVVEDVCSHVAILDNGTVVEQGSVRDIFSNPHSDAAKRLVFPAGTPERELLPGRKMVRVAFNGTQTTDKPLVASLAIECGALVSIVAADTRVVNGQTLGSMLLALPEGEGAAKALDYIKNYPGITYEEVGSNG